MNYLAHLYLADRADADMAGAILGDFVRGPDMTRFAPAIAHSIRLHRRIDTITDQHPLVLGAMARFEPGPRRYAPIILDVLWDYVLATDWARYSSEPYADFCSRGARAVAASGSLFEWPRRPTHSGFTTLLRSYATETGIDFALRRIAARLKKPEPMLEACKGWQQHAPALREELPALIGDLESAAKAFTTS
ncbi:ACP phosphodiesterase [Hydrocarboniphaga sp.]|uniref:acyl carrier protein phosphodiesterase n=1 Tax=Hydrocarboniphaga sp. TaxID=2033016 RepID=UPI002625BD8B|nr:ACP phosphodiesterase [Hydrocarboniphaga sp.]